MRWTVYAVESGLGECLWVGMTSRLTRRKWDHAQRFGDDIEIRELGKYAHPANANKAEYRYIKELNPKYNLRREDGGIGRPSYPIDKKRYIGKYIRFSKNELRILNRESKKRDVPLAKFIREAALEKAGA